MTRPLELPKCVLLVGDRTTRQLSYDVAKEMSNIDQTVYIDAFEYPIAEAWRAMFDKDWQKDFTNPAETKALVLESSDGKSEAEILLSLREWFEREFGPDTLTTMGHKRYVDQQAITEYVYVFHDANVGDTPFFKSKLKSHELLCFDVTKYAPDVTPESVITDMERMWERLDA